MLSINAEHVLKKRNGEKCIFQVNGITLDHQLCDAAVERPFQEPMETKSIHKNGEGYRGYWKTHTKSYFG